MKVHLVLVCSSRFRHVPRSSMRSTTLLATAALLACNSAGYSDKPKFILTDLSHKNENVTWDGLTGNITDAIGNVMNSILPQIVRATSEVELNADCTAAMFQFFLGLRKLTPWALRSEYRVETVAII